MKVLLKGGPRDGEYIDVPDGQRDLLIPLPAKPNYRWVATDPDSWLETFRVGRYRPSGYHRWNGQNPFQNGYAEAFTPIWSYDE